MKTQQRQAQRGMTLLETLLAIAVMAVLIIMGYRQYVSLRTYSEVEQVKYSVDTIASAAASYYYANCNPDKTLGPTVMTKNVNIDIQTELVDGGYLSNTVVPTNPLVDATASGTYRGYRLQFNRFERPRSICLEAKTGETATGPESDQGCETKTQIGTVVGWRLQVSVKPTDVSNLEKIYSMTSSESCVSSERNTTIVPCAEADAYASTCVSAYGEMQTQQQVMDASTPGSPAWQAAKAAYDAAQEDYNNAACTGSDFSNYVSYERLPSFHANPKAQSGLWTTKPRLRQFKQLYETNPTTNLTGTDHTTEYQYFYCGS